MTDRDWEVKFDILFKEDFIKVDDDFYNEDLCFTDPNDLNKIFSELEEQNLYLIHQSQEMEIALEKERKKHIELQEDLGNQYEMHKRNRNELKEQIQESRKNLNELKKKSMFGTIQTTAAHTSSEKGAAAAEQEVNIEELLNDLRADICRVYKSSKNNEMDL